MTTLLINSGPGTGKTTTISALTCYLRATNRDLWLQRNRHTDEQEAILKWVEANMPVKDDTKIIGMAYNREAADQLASKTHKSVKCSSAHGWGYSILNKRYGYLKINPARTFNIIEKHLGRSLHSHPDKYRWISTARYLEKLKDELLDPTPENLQRLAGKYDDLANFRYHSEMANQIAAILPAVKLPDRSVGIEYIDQVWLALFLLKSPPYDIAIIDEAQDMSPSRRMLADLIATHKIYVGDPDQAINAFAGADPYSIDKIREKADVELPLKCSFRCPPNVVQKLNAFKPTARLRGLEKPNGVEKRVLLSKIGENMEQPYGAHLMICRTNAPLIKVALELIRNQIPSRILGDRLIASLKTICEKQKATTLAEFEDSLDRYEANITRSVSDYIREQVQDKFNCIRLVIPLCNTVEEIVPRLEDFLKPRTADHVRLATIHKAKGLEAPNVWILFPPIQSPYATTPEQIAQEDNLRFVAESRTSCNTFWVSEE